MKTCEIINDQFSWVMNVDGKKICFQGSDNALYFLELYQGLGYKVTAKDLVKEKGRCERCGTDEGINKTVNPYSHEIYGNDEEVYLCGDCYENLRMSI